MLYILKIFILFLFLFDFKVPFFYDSSILSFFILIIILIFQIFLNKKFISLKIFYNKYIFNIFLFLFFIIIIALIFPIIDKTYDFTIIHTLIHQFISFIIAIFLIIVLNISASFEIKEMIIYAFFAQSLVEIIAFLSPDFLHIVQFFQKEIVIEIGKEYAGGGMRALALSGSQFFGLSSSFGFIYIVEMNYFKSKGNFSYFDAIILIVTIIGTFFAGRTGFVGLFFALIYFVIVRDDKMKKFSLLFKSILSIIILFNILFIFIFSNEIKMFFLKQVIPYAFEFLFNFINHGNLSTHSSDQLAKQYFVVDNYTYLFGRGINKIYLSDAGYMRNILYGGIGWFVLLALYQILIIYYNIKLDRKNKLFYLVLLIYLFVLHIKGEAVGFLIITQKILFLLLLTNVIDKKRRYFDK